MNTLGNHKAVTRASVFGFAIGSAILAYEPVQWLVSTWLDPSYQSSGLLYLAVIAGLLVWSLTSPVREQTMPVRHWALLLLVAAAVLRLISQLMAINIIGGVALALDVYALLTFFGLSHRERSVSPFWVSVLFLFTLPFERIAQRILGYPMQELSAFGACGLLSPWFDDLVCEGVRLQVGGQDVLVDLPCSGTASLMLCLAMVVTLNAVFRPSFSRAVCMILLTIALSVIGNAVRITLLAIGLAHQAKTGINVMEQPLHDVIGYLTIVASLAPVLWLFRSAPKISGDGMKLPAFPGRFRINIFRPVFAIAFLMAAFTIISMPRQAFDVSARLAEAEFPAVLNGAAMAAEPLLPVEQAYFEQFGGTAQKAFYGPLSLTVVRTSSPLRHLHAPDDCLRGLGYEVTFIGTRFHPVPTAIYRAEDPEGRQWKVAVTFTEAGGYSTSNVAEAIWFWLQNPGSHWQSIQRITPWDLHDETRDRFERATLAALDIQTTHELPNHTQLTVKGDDNDPA